MGIDHNHDTQNNACTCGTQNLMQVSEVQLVEEKQVNHCGGPGGLIQAIDEAAVNTFGPQNYITCSYIQPPLMPHIINTTEYMGQCIETVQCIKQQ